MSRPAYRGPSEAQANAEALARRGRTYGSESERSFDLRWNRREPTDLRDAVRQCRRAYADEVPPKLHDGPDVIGEDGTPRMTARAVGYIFGDERADDAGRDAETGQSDLMGYFRYPFRAALHTLSQGSYSEQRRGRIVSHVTIGGMNPVDAAIREHAHPFDARLVAEDTLRSFLRSSLTDVRLHVAKEMA